MQKARTKSDAAEIPGAPAVLSGQEDPADAFIVAQQQADARRAVEAQAHSHENASLEFGVDPEPIGETARDQMIREHGEQVVLAQEAEMLQAQAEKIQAAMETPAAIREAILADAQRNIERQQEKTGVTLGAAGNISQFTKSILEKEDRLGVYLMPEMIQTTDGPEMLSKRGGEINGVPFTVECGKFVKVPESIAMFCVCQGWCAPPISKTMEWEKHIPARSRALNLARIQPGRFGQEMSMAGSFLASAGLAGSEF